MLAGLSFDSLFGLVAATGIILTALWVATLTGRTRRNTGAEKPPRTMHQDGRWEQINARSIGSYNPENDARGEVSSVRT